MINKRRGAKATGERLERATTDDIQNSKSWLNIMDGGSKTTLKTRMKIIMRPLLDGNPVIKNLRQYNTDHQHKTTMGKCDKVKEEIKCNIQIPPSKWQ